MPSCNSPFGRRDQSSAPSSPSDRLHGSHQHASHHRTDIPFPLFDGLLRRPSDSSESVPAFRRQRLLAILNESLVLSEEVDAIRKRDTNPDGKPDDKNSSDGRY